MVSKLSGLKYLQEQRLEAKMKGVWKLLDDEITLYLMQDIDQSLYTLILSEQN